MVLPPRRIALAEATTQRQAIAHVPALLRYSITRLHPLRTTRVPVAAVVITLAAVVAVVAALPTHRVVIAEATAASLSRQQRKT